MRVYQINVTARFSTGILAGSIHSELKKQGHEARFAYGFGGIDTDGYFRIADIWTLRLNARWARLTGDETLFAKQPTKKLIQDIRNFSPDIIHLHNIHGNYVDYYRLLDELAVLRIPVILTLHDCWYYTGGCYHYTVNGCKKWKQECYSCQYQNCYWLHHLHPIEKREFFKKKNAFERIQKLYVTTVSVWLKTETESSVLGNREITCIPNGIDMGIYRPLDAHELRVQYRCEGKKVLLGVASTWSDRKGLHIWKKLAENLDDSYQVILVGLNQEQISGMPEKILGLPRVKNSDELVRLYNLADVYVNLSAEETFGLPTVEAMACGTPVVVLNSTANPELVDAEVGCVAASNEIKDILAAIQHVLAMSKVEASQKCVAKVREQYSIEVMVRKFLQLYRRILCEGEL